MLRNMIKLGGQYMQIRKLKVFPNHGPRTTIFPTSKGRRAGDTLRCVLGNSSTASVAFDVY